MDRNAGVLDTEKVEKASLSARRAWIEITIVAAYELKTNMSLSARRAWIEIANTAATLDIIPVALRKESVDRNRG